MSDVKRYGADVDLEGVAHVAGRYVTFADYDALRKEAEGLRAERDHFQQEADRRTREVELTYRVQKGLTARAESAEQARDALAERIDALIEIARGAWPDVTTLESAWDAMAGELMDAQQARDANAKNAARMREALHWIARHGCENYVKPYTCRQDAGRSRDAQYGADQWCDACVAEAAIQEQSS